MHVAHFIHRYPPARGGSEAYFERLSRWLYARGHDVTVWTTTAIDLTAFWSANGRRLRAGVSREAGVTVRRYEPAYWFAQRPMLKVLSYLPAAAWQCWTQACNPVAARMLYDALSDAGPCDAVHASAFPYAWPLMCGLRLARRKKAPYLLTPFLHAGDPDDPHDRTRRAYTSRAMRYLLRAADVVFVQTEIEGEAVRSLGIPFDRIILQGMGVDPAECNGGDAQRARADWNVPSGKVVVAHLANLSHAKGTIDLLRAARRAWERGAGFDLVLAGPQMPDFRRFWQDYAPKERVRILGELDETRKRDFYAGIDVFCLPSRSDSFGLVLLEAWANAKPVVAYRAGGVAELVRHERDGLLARCGDVDGLAEALLKLERDRDQREAYGLAGQARVGREFVWEEKLQKVEAALVNVSIRADDRVARNTSVPS